MKFTIRSIWIGATNKGASAAMHCAVAEALSARIGANPLFCGLYHFASRCADVASVGLLADPPVARIAGKRPISLHVGESTKSIQCKTDARSDLIMPNLRKIKDPIYGYIYYSALEEKIITHRLVLRLHYIRQNGSAYLTYPSMRVHRFEHSLGAMHVAGSLFKSASEFSGRDVDGLLKEIVEAVTAESVGALMKEIARADANLSFLKDDGFYKFNCLERVDEASTFVRLFVFQSVRIAALVHDIGHPPLSHVFETALKHLPAIKYSSHESVGLELFQNIVEDTRDSETGAWYSFGKNVLKLVTAIIDRENIHHSQLKGLSEIISGDIDADRLDYVRRDTLSGGSNTTSFDLGRLIDSVRFRVDDGDAKRTLSLVQTTDALSTIEAFFSVRFHLYRWMLWHHNVIRMNLAILLSIKLFSKLRNSELTSIARVSNEVLSLAADKKKRKDYWRFTDNFFLDRLVVMLIELEKNVKKFPAGTAGEPYILLRRYLRTFLFREKLHLRPLWKRPDDYVDFANIVLRGVVPKDGSSSAKALNELVRSAYENFVRAKASADGVDVSGAENLESYERPRVDYLAGAFCSRLEKEVSRDLTAQRIRIRAYYLAKFRPAPTGLYLYNRDDLIKQISISVLSPSVIALDDAWKALPQLWLLVENLPETGTEDVPPADSSRKGFYEPVGKALARYLRSLSPKREQAA